MSARESAFFAGAPRPAAPAPSGVLQSPAANTRTGSKLTTTPSASSSTHSTYISSRGLRFPSSRLYLWDRTPAGPQVLLDLQDATPHVHVAANAFATLQKAAAQQQPTAQLQLRLAVSSSNSVTALIQAPDPLSGGSGLELLPLGCQLRPKPDQEVVLGTLLPVLQAHLDQKGSAATSQLYAVAAWSSPPSNDPLSSSSSGRATLVQLSLVQPATSLLLTPLFTKRLCAVPLSEQLLAPGRMPPWQTGYLSMDQARSLLPLAADDSQVFSTPLVGVWVKGPSSPCHPLVAAACLKFCYSHVLLDRAMQRDASFLLLLCPEGEPVSRCYEVQPSHPLQLPLRSYQLSVSGSVVAPAPDQSASAAWVADAVPPEPLEFTPPSCVQQPLQAAAAGLNRSWQAGGMQGAAGRQGRTWDSPASGAGVSRGQPWSYDMQQPNPTAAAAGVGGAGGGLGPVRIPRAPTAAVARSWPSPYTAARGPSPGLAQSPAGLTGGVTGQYGVDLTSGTEEGAPQPRSGVPPGPYACASPVPMAAGATGAPDAAPMQHRQQQEEGQEDEQDTPEGRWLQLGQDLLYVGRDGALGGGHPYHQQQQQQHLERPLSSPAQLYTIQPGGTGPALWQDHGSDVGHQEQGPSLGDPAGGGDQQQQQQQQPVRSPSGRSWSQQHEQALRSSLGSASAAISGAMAALSGAAAATGVEADIGREVAAPFGGAGSQDLGSSPRLGSPVKAARQVAPATAGGTGGSAAVGGSSRAGAAGSFEPHPLRPTSPAVAATVAMSHLSLLHHLSTGQLQEGLERVASPTRSRSPSPSSNRPGASSPPPASQSATAAGDDGPGGRAGGGASSGGRYTAQALAAAGAGSGSTWAPSPTHRMPGPAGARDGGLRASLEASAAAVQSVESALAAAEAAVTDNPALSSSPGRRRFAQQLQEIQGAGSSSGSPRFGYTDRPGSGGSHLQQQQQWVYSRFAGANGLSPMAGGDAAVRSSFEQAQAGIAGAAAALDAAAAELGASAAAHGGLAVQQMWLEQQQQQHGGQYPADAAGYAAFGSSSMQLAAVPQAQGALRWPGVAAASSDYSGTPDSLQAEVMKLKAELAAVQEQLHLASQPYVLPQHMLQPLTPPAALAAPSSAPGHDDGSQATAAAAAATSSSPASQLQPQQAPSGGPSRVASSKQRREEAEEANATMPGPVSSAAAEAQQVGARQEQQQQGGDMHPARVSSSGGSVGSGTDFEATLARGVAGAGERDSSRQTSSALDSTLGSDITRSSSVAAGRAAAAAAAAEAPGAADLLAALPPSAMHGRSPASGVQQQQQGVAPGSPGAAAALPPPAATTPAQPQSPSGAAAVGSISGQAPQLAATFYKSVGSAQKASPAPRAGAGAGSGSGAARALYVGSPGTTSLAAAAGAGASASGRASRGSRRHGSAASDSDEDGLPMDDGVELLRRSAEGRWAALAAGSTRSSLQASAELMAPAPAAAEGSVEGSALRASSSSIGKAAGAGLGSEQRPGSAAGLRTSQQQLLGVAPLPEVVRTVYEPLSDDEGDSDDAEFEQQLLRKYGLAQRAK